MAYVITDTCIKDLIVRGRVSDRLHSPQERRAGLRGGDPALCRSRAAASTVELAFQCAPRIRSLP